MVRERAPKLLKRFGLADRGGEPIARFSKGMVQRLGLAQALLNEPRLLVLDEPTEGLDLEGRRLLRDAAAEVRSRGGSVLLVSHVLTEVEQLCDRVGVLMGGRLVHVGPLAEFVQPPDQGQDAVAGTGVAAILCAGGEMTAIASVAGRCPGWSATRSGRRWRPAASWLMLAGSAACVGGCLVAPLDGPAARHALEQQLAGWAVHAVGLLLALVADGGDAAGVPRPARGVGPAGQAGAALRFCWPASSSASWPSWPFTPPCSSAVAWLALAVRGGAWDPTFLLVRPLLVLHFAVFFSFSVMLAVATRNTAACVVRDGAVLAAVLGDEFRPARGDRVAGPALRVAGLRLDHRRRLTGCCPSRSTSSWR